MVRCALPAGDTLVKQDNSGINYTFNGGIGLAPEWKTGGCTKDCLEKMSSCLMAHINTSGVHIPLWMTSPDSAVGWGQSASFPTQEGTFFGQIMLTNPSNNLDAYFCSGAGVSNDVVPGRLGSASNSASAPYANAYPTDGGQCNKAGHCVMQANGDGAVSCVGNGITWTHPLTVWRGQIFQAENATIPSSNMVVSDNANSNGRRVGNIGPTATVKFTGVKAAVAGQNQLVVYYADGDCGSAQRYFNIKVNGGPAQNRVFNIVDQANWHAIGQSKITLDGFKADSTNTIEFLGDGVHSAPDLDWIEIINTSTTGTAASTVTPATSACAAGKTVALLNTYNGKYASARQEDNGNVKAIASVASTWEMFDIVDAGGGYVALRSKMNNLYVATEVGTTNAPLRARSSSIGAWEKYTIETVSGGYAFKSAGNGMYVQADIEMANDDVMARVTGAGAWETWNCQ
jgi:hypothetical protein